MAKEYVKHDEEFKKMIVNLCETSKDKTMSDIAREYGITRASITHWRKKYGTITTSTGETTSNDEILILQTCSTDKAYRNYQNKYLLIILRRVLNEEI